MFANIYSEIIILAALLYARTCKYEYKYLIEWFEQFDFNKCFNYLVSYRFGGKYLSQI